VAQKEFPVQPRSSTFEDLCKFIEKRATCKIV
jgi:hypothetical protein